MGLWEEGHRGAQPEHMGCQKGGKPTRVPQHSRDTASHTVMLLASFRPFGVKWTSQGCLSHLFLVCRESCHLLLCMWPNDGEGDLHSCRATPADSFVSLQEMRNITSVKSYSSLGSRSELGFILPFPSASPLLCHQCLITQEFLFSVFKFLQPSENNTVRKGYIVFPAHTKLC